MQEKENFNQRKYMNEWKKMNKLQFKADLNKNEKLEIDNLLKEYNMTKVEFIRLSVKALKEGKIKKGKDN